VQIFLLRKSPKGLQLLVDKKERPPLEGAARKGVKKMKEDNTLAERADLEEEMIKFAVRVLRGEGEPQETAILPEILKMIIKSTASGN